MSPDDRPDPGQQRLLAILEADGVGYSRLMAADPEGTVAQLDAARAVFRRHIEAEGGRVVDMAGDSVLAVFATALAAVKAAQSVQTELGRLGAGRPDGQRLRHRIGIHVGDVIEKPDGTVYGSGVNIAARLEALAPPGGVAVSQAVRDMVASRLPALGFADLGLHEVRNIPEPVRALALAGLGSSGGAAAALASPRRGRGRGIGAAAAVLCLLLAAGGLWWWQARPASSGTVGAQVAAEQSVAVLPFASRGADAADTVFAEGLSEELMTLLGRSRALRVTARSSSFSFRGKALPATEIARQLGVDYLVDGSVQREGSRVRIHVELVRGSDGRTLWSERFDRDLADALKVQQLAALQVAQKLSVPLNESRIATSGTRNPEAYRLYLQARLTDETDAGLQSSIELLRRAVALDPQYAAAHVMLAALQLQQVYLRLWGGQLSADQARAALQPTLDSLARAGQLDPANVRVQATRHDVLMLLGDQPGAAAALNQALELDPNDSMLLDRLAEARLAEGDVAGAVQALQRMVTLTPLSAGAYIALANGLLFSGEPTQALAAAERALALAPEAHWALFIAAEVNYAVGRHEEALRLAREAASREPQWNAVLWRLGTDADRQRMKQSVGARGSPLAKVTLALLEGDTGPMLAFLEAGRGTADLYSRILFYPLYDPLREDPRFQALLKRHGLEQAQARALAWRAAHPIPHASERLPRRAGP